jgi:hypothetical protein
MITNSHQSRPGRPIAANPSGCPSVRSKSTTGSSGSGAVNGRHAALATLTPRREAIRCASEISDDLPTPASPNTNKPAARPCSTSSNSELTFSSSAERQQTHFRC